MARIPFNIEFRLQIESGEYKVFAHEHVEQEARIVCWDNKGQYPIVALVDNEPEKFDKYGRVPGGNRGGEFSLFLVTPEPDMSELELAIAKYRPPTDSKETIQRIAAELLALARKQLQPEIDAEIEKAYKNVDEVQYRKGREEALKDLPRWRKATGKERFDERMIVLTGDNDLFCTNYAEEGEYYLPFPILEKLPKEDSHE